MKKKKRGLYELEPLVKRYINQFGSGIHRSALKDIVGDTDAVREYVPGDKRLDSVASLKVGKVMSRVRSPEKSMSIFILLDTSKSQFYGFNNLKIEAGIVAGAYLANLAGSVGDKVGILTFDQIITNLQEPTTKEKDVINILDSLEEAAQSGTNWRLAMERVIGLNLDNSLIVLISDFCFAVEDSFLKLLRQLSSGKNNSLIALVLVDDNEWQMKNLPFEANFLDAESDRQAILLAPSKKTVSFKENLMANLRRGRCEPLLIDINSPNFLMPLIKYFLRNIS